MEENMELQLPPTPPPSPPPIYNPKPLLLMCADIILAEKHWWKEVCYYPWRYKPGRIPIRIVDLLIDIKAEKKNKNKNPYTPREDGTYFTLQNVPPYEGWGSPSFNSSFSYGFNGLTYHYSGFENANDSRELR